MKCPICGFYFPGTLKRDTFLATRVLVLIKQGHTQSQIARFFHVSRQWINQTIEENNLKEAYREARDIKEINKYVEDFKKRIRYCALCGKRFILGFKRAKVSYCSDHCYKKKEKQGRTKIFTYN